ncbi:MAG: YcgN family cysteine cluster protein [Granulosicoccaceae bacterium]
MKWRRWKNTIDADQPYWQSLSLSQMSSQQWEGLCDGCGRCCLHKLETPSSCEFTCVACKLLDVDSCRCKNYSQRQAKVPDCLVLSAAMSAKLYSWLPFSCAYRRLAEGRGLASWHPLVSGSLNTVRSAGVCVTELAITEREALRFDTLDAYVTSLSSPPE